MKLGGLETLRCRAGLSQGQLAHISRISKDTISKIENGQRENAHARTVAGLADALGVAPEELNRTGSNGDGTEDEARLRQEAVTKRLELFEIGKELSDERLELVLSLARELAMNAGENRGGRMND